MGILNLLKAEDTVYGELMFLHADNELGFICFVTVSNDPLGFGYCDG